MKQFHIFNILTKMSHPTTTIEKNIYFLIKFKSYVNKLYGNQRLHIHHGKIMEIGMLYKLYVLVFAIFTSVAILLTITVYTKYFPLFPFAINISLFTSYFSTLFGYVMVTLRSCIFLPTKTKDFYLKISRLFNHFDTPKVWSRNFKIYIITIHILILFIEVYHLNAECLSRGSILVASYHLAILIIESEVTNFNIDASLLVKLFELMNCRLEEINSMKLYDKITKKAKMNKTISIYENKKWNTITACLHIYNSLMNSINDINECYGLTVHIN